VHERLHSSSLLAFSGIIDLICDSGESDFGTDFSRVFLDGPSFHAITNAKSMFRKHVSRASPETHLAIVYRGTVSSRSTDISGYAIQVGRVAFPDLEHGAVEIVLRSGSSRRQIRFGGFGMSGFAASVAAPGNYTISVFRGRQSGQLELPSGSRVFSIADNFEFYPLARVVFDGRSDVLETLIICDVSAGDVRIENQELVTCDGGSGEVSSDTPLTITGTGPANRVVITNSNLTLKLSDLNLSISSSFISPFMSTGSSVIILLDGVNSITSLFTAVGCDSWANMSFSSLSGGRLEARGTQWPGIGPGLPGVCGRLSFVNATVNAQSNAPGIGPVRLVNLTAMGLLRTFWS
jgi:hypothetical protein